MYGELYEELQGIFSPVRLDLLFLEETGYLFQFEALTGLNVYRQSDKIFTDYIERVIKHGRDLKLDKDIFDREILEAVSRGQVAPEYKAAY